MPIYEYRCLHCDHLFEDLHKMNADMPQCPVCRGPVQRLISQANFRLKGAGFHSTDYTGTGPKVR